MIAYGRVSAGCRFINLAKFRAELAELKVLRTSGSLGCSSSSTSVTHGAGNCRAYAGAATPGVLRDGLMTSCSTV